MFKTLFASASTFAYVGCIAICCMGNEYPAKAYDSSWEAMQARQEIREAQRQTENQIIELERKIRAEQYRNGYGSF